MKRRDLLKTAGISGLAASFFALKNSSAPFLKTVKPKRLNPGDTVALICPSGAADDRVEVQVVKESLEALGFKVKPANHILDRYGYVGGKDRDRAADVNSVFADSTVAGIVAVKGGWGCARILPLLDYDLIRRNPKVLIGMSDITALLLGIYAKTGLVTFYGPTGVSPWNAFTVQYFKKVLMEGEAAEMRNPSEIGDNLAQVEDRVQTIFLGRASGRLEGGCLSIISTLLGTDFLPDWDGSILFVEDVNEEIYRIDRMLTHLKLAGVLSKVKGFIFGRCTECEPGEGYGSLSLEQLFDDHIMPLGIPAWYGSMIGHIPKKFTVPIGVQVEIDSEKGLIRMLEPAVL